MALPNGKLLRAATAGHDGNRTIVRTTGFHKRTGLLLRPRSLYRSGFLNRSRLLNWSGFLDRSRLL